MPYDLEAFAKEAGSVQWLWPGRIPYGMASLVCGDQGTGKTFLMHYCADCVLGVKEWPDGYETPKEERGRTLWIDMEGAKILLSDRCKQWQLGAKSIVFPPDDFQPGDFMRENFLYQKFAKTFEEFGDVAMVVVDSLGMVLAGASKTERNEHALPVIRRLNAVAEGTEKAVVVIHHYNKPPPQLEDRPASIFRVRGGTGVTQLTTVVNGLEREVFDTDVRRVKTLKNNICMWPNSFRFKLSVEEGFLPLGELSGEEAIMTVTKRGEAVKWLKELLSDGPMHYQDIEKASADAGYAIMTVRRGFKKLGGHSIRNPNNPKRTLWEMPTETTDVVDESNEVHTP